jgi:hypothetical protein
MDRLIALVQYALVAFGLGTGIVLAIHLAAST